MKEWAASAGENLAEQTVEDAVAMMLEATPLLGTESVSLLDSLGRVLAKDLTSDIDVAPFDNSAMDGFAVIAHDIESASEDTPVLLEVVSHIGAGDYSDLEIVSGQAARIMTGAPMPPGADTVVKVEETYLNSGEGGIGSVIAFPKAIKQGANVRYRAEEVAAGEVTLTAGEKVTPAAIGLMAATGNALVEVYKRPRVGIIATGSELVEIDETPGRGQIRNSNNYSLSAQVIASGGIPVRFALVEDTFEATLAALREASETCDFIVTSGGVSVGDFDYVKPALEELGDMLFCKVNMRPGNPQTLGTITNSKGQIVPFFGLPGNPTSTFVGFEIFVRPALRKMQGFTELVRPFVEARLTHPIKKRQGRRYYMRGLVYRAADGGYEAKLAGDQSSALLRSAHLGNCFIVLPEGIHPASEGDIVKCIRLDWEEGVE